MTVRDAMHGAAPMQHLPLVRLIQWGEHLSVGHPEIDAQHEAIMGLGVKLYEGWRTGDRVDALRPGVEKLVKLLPAHLAYEERVLSKIGYEDLEQHAAEHRSMLTDLADMKARFDATEDATEAGGGSLLAPGWPITQFFLEFAVGHVATSDMGYYQALEASTKARQRS